MAMTVVVGPLAAVQDWSKVRLTPVHCHAVKSQQPPYLGGVGS